MTTLEVEEVHHGTKSPSENSPTRVTDFDSSQYVEGEKEKDDMEKQSPIHALEPPRIEITPLHRKKRRNLMPTVEERSITSTGEESAEDPDEDAKTVQLSNVSQRRTSNLTSELSVEEVKKLTVTASNLASRGKETQALQRYHHALRMTRMGAKRVKNSLEDKQVDKSKKPQLYDEWCQLTRTIADICTNMAVLYERIGDYKGALSSCREAHAVYQKISKTNGNLHDHASRLSQMMNQLKQASKTFVERKRLHQTAIHTRKLISATKDPQKKAKLYGELFKTLKKALKMEQESLGEAHPQVADTVGLIATAHVETNDHAMALEQFRSAVSILRLSLGPDHPKTGMGFKQLGSLYDSRRKYPSDMEKALHFYGEAVASFREAYGKHNALVGSTLNNMAVIYIQQKEYERAIDTLNDALASYENVAINNNGVHSNTAQIWRNLGQVYALRGEWESSILAYASSLEVQRACVDPRASEESQEVMMSNQSIADTLKKLGKAMAAVGRHEDALEIYSEALQIHQAAVAMTKNRHAAGRANRTDVLVAQEKVAETMQCMGGVQESCGNLDEAMLIYVSTLMLRRQNVSLSEDHSADGVETALSMSGIGSVHLRKGEFNDASTVLEESLRIFKNNGLPDDHHAVVKAKQRFAEAQRSLLASQEETPPQQTSPQQTAPQHTPSQVTHTKQSKFRDSTKRVRKDHTLTLDAKAQALVEDRDYDGAIRILTQVLVKRRQRLTKQQTTSTATTINIKEKDDVARTLCAFAEVLSKKGDFEQAQVLLEESLKLYKANGADEDDPRVKGVVSELNRLSVVHVE